VLALGFLLRLGSELIRVGVKVRLRVRVRVGLGC
jgi:hypothetical protein